MGVNINVSHADFPFRAKYYDHAYSDDDTALESTLKIKGIIYVKKLSSEKKSNYVTRDGNKVIKHELTVYTEDFCDDLLNDDFLIIGRDKWIVKHIEEQDLSSNKSRSVFKGTTISLRR